MSISDMLYWLYHVKSNRIRKGIRTTIKHIEGGEFYSVTLRKIFKRYHNVTIGLYTHGGCFVPGRVAPFSTIGRYSSIAHGVRILNRDHPIEFKSTHAFFFRPHLGYCTEDRNEFTPITIGNDVWIGQGATILPNVKTIGDGAVIGAGANVNKDIPPYGIAVGNPARLVRYRFSKEIINALLESKWWENSIEEIAKNDIEEYMQPYDDYLKTEA